MVIDESKFKITIMALKEDEPVRGNAIASGDDVEDKRVEDEIIFKRRTNRWAWCAVELTAEIDGFEGTAYLGCCSYKNKDDFINNSGYYEDMKEEAIQQIIAQLKAAEATLAKITGGK